MRLVATWWTTGVAALFVLALVSSSACSGNGNGNETEVKDVGDVGDADARIDLDVPPDKESTEIDLKDSGKDEPEGDIPDVPQDEEIMTPPDGEIGEDEVEQPTCELPCAEIGDCEGKFPDVDKCHVEICIPDEICAAKNPGMLGKCELIKKDPLCCIKNEQCMDDNICTINEKCVNNLCTNELDLTNPACCVNNVLVKLDFENIQTGEMPPAEKAYCTDKQPGDNVICSVQPTPLGGKAVYFGDPVCKTYNSGQMVDCLAVEKIECTEQTQDEDCPAPLADCDNNGDCVPSPKAARVTLELVVPELNLPSDSLLKLTFRYLMKAEEPIPGSLYNFDTLDVFARVAEGGGTEEELAYSSIEFDNDTQGKFVLIAANLTKYAGKSIDLVFRFDTFEGTENDHLGTYIDDITVGTFCSEDTCDKTSDCNDKNVCTADECAEFKNTGGGSLVGVCLNELGDPCCTQCATVDDCAVKCGEPIGECTLAACEAVGAEGKKCVWSPNPECCTQDDLGQYGKQGFESGKLPDQWSVEAQPGNPYKWDVVSTQADPKGGDIYALAFGAGSYDCGQTHCWGKFTTGKFDLTKVSPKAFVKLTFMLRLGTEWDKVDPSEYVPVGIDTLKVFAVTEKDESIQVWSSDVIFGTTGYTQDPKGELPDIRPVWADLTQFTGQKIALRFEFDTGDVNPPANDYYGVLMDELVVESVCEQVCLAAADCVSGGDCMKGKCIDGVCGYDSIPECCTAIYNPKCDDKDACTDDACDVGAKLCSHKYSGAPGCCTAKEQLFYDNFDAPDNAWKVLEPGSPCGDGECEEPESCITCPSDCKVCTVRWQVVDKQAFTPKSSLYFGNTDTWTYFNGAAPAYGKITSAPFQLPPYGIPIVSFMLWLETEHGAQFVEPADFDKLTLYVEWADKVDGPWSPATAAWNSLSWDVKGNTDGWEEIKVGINKASIKGKFVRFTLEFNSFDSFGNDYFGAFVDDFKVKTVCNDTYACTSAVECPESTPDEPHCSIEACTAGACVPSVNPNKTGCCVQELLPLAEEKKAGWSFDTCKMEDWKATPPAATVMWQISESHPCSGKCSLWFGNKATGDYSNGTKAVNGSICSPDIDVTGMSAVELSFCLWADLKDPYHWLDSLSLKMDSALFAGGDALGVKKQLWHKPCTPEEFNGECDDPKKPLPPCDKYGCEGLPAQTCTCFKQVVDVTDDQDGSGYPWVPGVNHRAIFCFEFDSGDGAGNKAAGVFIDDFQVKTLCK